MKKILDLLILMLAIAIAWMALTGGAVFMLPQGKIEASSLDPWVAAIAVLFFLRARVTTGDSGPIFRRFVKLLDQLQEPLKAKKTAFRLLLVVIASLFVAHMLRHASFGTDVHDLTFVHQSIFEPFASGRLLKCDVCISGSYLGEHLSFTLLLLSPVTALFKSDALVFVLQAAMIFLGVWWLLRLGPLRPKPSLLALAVLIVLANRALRNSLVWDFKEDHLAFFFLCMAVIGLFRKNIWFYLSALVLALLSKENIAFVALFLVIPILWDPHLAMERAQRNRWAVFTLLASVGWAVVAFKILIPHFSPTGMTANNIVTRFPGLGESPLAVLMNMLTPSIAWPLFKAKVLHGPALKYLVLLIGPYLFFAWRAPLWFVPALPGLAMNLLSGAETQRSLQFHYDLIILPFLMTALFCGMRTWSHKTVFAEQRLQQLAYAVIIALALSGRWPGRAINDHFPRWPELHATAMLNELPDAGVVAANPRLLGQISHFRDLRVLGIAAPAPSWDEFWRTQMRDRTGLPGHGAYEAEILVLDLELSAEKWLYEQALQRGWREITRDTSGRWVAVKQM